MFKNYFKIALRNIFKYKVTSIINIIGLAFGIACCILLLLFVQFELGYDKFQRNGNSIFKILTHTNNKESNYDGGTPVPLGPTIKRNFPECLNAVRLTSSSSWKSIRYKDKWFNEENIIAADSDIFRMFTFEFIKGTLKTALSDPNCVVINEEIAKKYFGEEDPLFKTIIVGKDIFKITGIVKNLPANSSLNIRAIISIANSRSFTKLDNHWGNNLAETYIQIKSNSSAQQLEKKINNYLNKNLNGWPEENTYFTLQPFNRIHLYSNSDYGIDYFGDYRTVIIYSVIALFILLIAIINFINISIAQTTTRFKEIGLRKVLGAFKKQILFQFLSEAFIICLLATILGIALGGFLLPEFNQLANRQINFNLDCNTLSYIVAVFLFTCIIIGIFPALLFSKYQSISLLNSMVKISSNSGFTKSLIILQFSLSVFFMICTSIMSQQISFIMNRHHVPEKEKIIEISTKALSSIFPNWEMEKEKVDAFINDVSRSSLINYSAYKPGGIRIFKTEYNGREWSGALIDFTDSYFKMFNIKIVKGRSFNVNEFPTDSTSSIIINETFAKENKIENPVGKIISLDGKQYSIIGIVEDFSLGNIKQKIGGLAIKNSNTSTSKLYFTANRKDIPNIINLLKSKWTEFFPNALFAYTFYDESWEKEYSKEISSRELLNFVSIITLLLAGFGVLGLTTLTVARKTKEIGIRKVLGASSKNIFFLLTKQFGLMILIASIIASAFAYYYMTNWLSDFAYHVDIKVWTFIFATIVTLFISTLLIAFKSIKAATANLVESLKYE
ncbi:MAG: ABC transporter permease [Ignavibacteriales bacterium]|nr:MAG: ABC transporter permease [Ignavibacteriales bacterium]